LVFDEDIDGPTITKMRNGHKQPNTNIPDDIESDEEDENRQGENSEKV
jgi:hypothetical protein